MNSVHLIIPLNLYLGESAGLYDGVLDPRRDQGGWKGETIQEPLLALKNIILGFVNKKMHFESRRGAKLVIQKTVFFST